mmetsp:Transcript_29776/g.81647  ORF Transcript_29776/g.81647 Transcript_29776/m.81647 type:complete len:219 (+) Transcript_29776:1496-2152(+)
MVSVAGSSEAPRSFRGTSNSTRYSTRICRDEAVAGIPRAPRKAARSADASDSAGGPGSGNGSESTCHNNSTQEASSSQAQPPLIAAQNVVGSTPTAAFEESAAAATGWWQGTTTAFLEDEFVPAACPCTPPTTSVVVVLPPVGLLNVTSSSVLAAFTIMPLAPRNESPLAQLASATMPAPVPPASPSRTMPPDVWVAPSNDAIPLSSSRNSRSSTLTI